MKIHHRLFVPNNTIRALLPSLEKTRGSVRCGNDERCRSHTIRGVPGNRIILAITDVDFENDTRWRLVAEIGDVEGSYNNTFRTSINIRCWPLRQTHWSDAEQVLKLVEEGTLDILLDGRDAVVSAIWQGGSWERKYERLLCDLSDYDLTRIVYWHWERYFDFLPLDIVKPLADSFEARNPQVRKGTLAEANRVASYDLYLLARSLGWRKLKDKERRELDVASLWVKESTLPGHGSPE